MIDNISRRGFIGKAAAGAATVLLGCRENGEGTKDVISYVQANTDWFAACRYGIGVHWTAQTVPRKGAVLSFQDAVDAFDVNNFLNAISESGADYLIFTSTHALQMLPAPHPVLDSILPGRTCKRDLIMEIAQGLAKRGKHLILYYNHSCNVADDPEWEKAVGYHDPDKNRLADNLCEIVAWMGQHYADLIKGWWFDSAYSLDSRGPHKSVTTDMGGFLFPWERFTEAAKVGLPSRLVTYNAGINKTYLYTTHQDYWAGEMVDLNHPPQSRFMENGLQWHGWTCLDDRKWVHKQLETKLPDVLYSDEQLFSFVGQCNLYHAPMAFNVGIYQDSTISAPAIRQLRRLGEYLENLK